MSTFDRPALSCLGVTIGRNVLLEIVRGDQSSTLHTLLNCSGWLSLFLGITIVGNLEKSGDYQSAGLRTNMRVYLDNSVIGRLMDIERCIKRGSKLLEEDVAMLPNLVQQCHDKGIQICASDDAGAEIEKLRSTMPRLTDALMSKLQSFTLPPIRHAIRYDDGHHYDMGATYAGDSPSEVDLLTRELEAFLLNKTRVTNQNKSNKSNQETSYKMGRLSSCCLQG